MKKIFVLLLCLFSAGLFSCKKSAGKKNVVLKIVNWNAQTFFDANKDGLEYQEFIKSPKWGKDAYTARLKRLCKAIASFDADVVILEEIENSGIVYDISNQLAGSNWNPQKTYRYGAFSKKEGSSIGCAILSRHQLDGLKIHSLAIASEEKEEPSMRPLMEVDLIVERGKDSRRLKLFVNHWKSKSGGDGSALWRRWQESLLTERIFAEQKINSNTAIVCAGDFNQDISEFNIRAAQKNQDNKKSANIEFDSFFSGKKVFVYSPWIDFSEEGGSYNFKDKWERIDHFFVCGDLSMDDFAVQKGEWNYEDGRPKPFKVYSLNGWSDHLPIMCKIRL